jgi:hypothetical protein
MTEHELLVRARNLLARPKGWRQGSNGRPPGPVCFEGALLAAAGVGEGSSYAALIAAQEVVYRVLRLRPYCLADWNDERKRTQAEVVAACDRAIALTAPEPDVSFIEQEVFA